MKISLLVTSVPVFVLEQGKRDDIKNKHFPP